MKKKNWLFNYIVLTLASVLCLQLVLSFDTTSSADINATPYAISGLSGSGTSANPYKINDQNDFYILVDYVNAGGATKNTYFDLTTNIKIYDKVGGIIDGNTRSFSGIFDGNGHSITFNYYDYNSGADIGIFSYLYGTVKNLIVLDGNVELLENDKSAGAIAGSAYSGAIIENCINVNCTIEAAGKTSNFNTNIGGIVGYVSGNVKITNCANFADVLADASGTVKAGGIVGEGGNAQISQCFNMGTVKAGLNDTDFKIYTPNLAYAGGIAGNIDAKIENSFNRGSIFSNAIEKEETVTTYANKYQEVVNGSGNSTLYSAKPNGIISSTPLGGGDYFRRGLIIEKNEIAGFLINTTTPINTDFPVNVLTRTYNEAYAGGIAGYSSTMPRYCYNTGTVTGGKSYYNLYFTYYFAAVSNAYGGSNPVRSAWLGSDSTYEAMRVVLTDVQDRFYYSPITGNMNLINSSSFINSYCYYLNSFKSNCYSSSNIAYRNYAASRRLNYSGTSSYWSYADINGRTPIPSFSNYYASKSYKLSELTNEVNIAVGGFSSFMKTSIQCTNGFLYVYINGNDSGYGKHRMLSLSIPGYNAEKKYLNSTNISKSENTLKNLNSINLSKTYWATNSLINNGYPYLKSFYWKDATEPF